MALDRVSASLFSLKPHIENFLTSVKATNQSLLAYMAGCISLIRSLADAPSGRLVKSFRVVQPKAELTEGKVRHSIEGECETYRSIFIIAQLRHPIAHGALSADRAVKLGLVPSFDAGP